MEIMEIKMKRIKDILIYRYLILSRTKKIADSRRIIKA